MKVIFAGTPEFAAIALEALIHSEHEVVAVFTQPDKPAGRGLKVTHSAVKEVALQFNIPVYQPVSLKDSYQQAIIAQLDAEVMVVAAYGMLLPAAVLKMTKLGCINIHPSLLPRWRGAAPIQRTIHAGDSISGVTIMQMDEGLDTGPILLQRTYVLDRNETSQTLHDKLATLGATLLLETLTLLATEEITPLTQDNTQSTYAHKISKEEALIDWQQPAKDIELMIRAFVPWPIAHTSWQGKNLRIGKAKLITQTHQTSPRTILHCGKDGIDIATGKGVLRLLQLQLPGGKMLSVTDFYNAHQRDLKVGEHLI